MQAWGTLDVFFHLTFQASDDPLNTVIHHTLFNGLAIAIFLRTKAITDVPTVGEF
jgi:hypothetical protein